MATPPSRQAEKVASDIVTQLNKDFPDLRLPEGDALKHLQEKGPEIHTLNAVYEAIDRLIRQCDALGFEGIAEEMYRRANAVRTADSPSDPGKMSDFLYYPPAEDGSSRGSDMRKLDYGHLNFCGFDIPLVGDGQWHEHPNGLFDIAHRASEFEKPVVRSITFLDICGMLLASKSRFRSGPFLPPKDGIIWPENTSPLPSTSRTIYGFPISLANALLRAHSDADRDIMACDGVQLKRMLQCQYIQNPRAVEASQYALRASHAHYLVKHDIASIAPVSSFIESHRTRPPVLRGTRPRVRVNKKKPQTTKKAPTDPSSTVDSSIANGWDENGTPGFDPHWRCIATIVNKSGNHWILVAFVRFGENLARTATLVVDSFGAATRETPICMNNVYGISTALNSAGLEVYGEGAAGAIPVLIDVHLGQKAQDDVTSCGIHALHALSVIRNYFQQAEHPERIRLSDLLATLRKSVTTDEICDATVKMYLRAMRLLSAYAYYIHFIESIDQGEMKAAAEVVLPPIPEGGGEDDVMSASESDSYGFHQRECGVVIALNKSPRSAIDDVVYFEETLHTNYVGELILAAITKMGRAKELPPRVADLLKVLEVRRFNPNTHSSTMEVINITDTTTLSNLDSKGDTPIYLLISELINTKGGEHVFYREGWWHKTAPTDGTSLIVPHRYVVNVFVQDMSKRKLDDAVICRQFDDNGRKLPGFGPLSPLASFANYVKNEIVTQRMAQLKELFPIDVDAHYLGLHVHLILEKKELNDTSDWAETVQSAFSIATKATTTNHIDPSDLTDMPLAICRLESTFGTRTLVKTEDQSEELLTLIFNVRVVVTSEIFEVCLYQYDATTNQLRLVTSDPRSTYEHPLGMNTTPPCWVFVADSVRSKHQLSLESDGETMIRDPYILTSDLLIDLMRNGTTPLDRHIMDVQECHMRFDNYARAIAKPLNQYFVFLIVKKQDISAFDEFRKRGTSKLTITLPLTADEGVDYDIEGVSPFTLLSTLITMLDKVARPNDPPITTIPNSRGYSFTGTITHTDKKGLTYQEEITLVDSTASIKKHYGTYDVPIGALRFFTYENHIKYTMTIDTN